MLKRVDSLIVGEMIGPWMFGVAIFTVLIMAGTYLFKITDYVVQGVGISTVFELTLLLLPGVMAKTFPMGMLLATLLAFGRLSGDSEVVALRACGTSLPRIIAPVACFGLAVSILAFVFNEVLVPQAALRATSLQEQIASKLEGVSARPTSYPIFEHGQLIASVNARDFSLVTRTLTGAVITTYSKEGRPTFFLTADELVYQGEKDWRIRGHAQLLSADGSTLVRLNGGAWPQEVPRPVFSEKDLLAKNLKDLDSLSLVQMRQQIDTARANPQFDPGQLANLEFGYYNKFAVPLAALVFGLVGAPLGVRNHRTGAATGFWISVIIIFGYMMLANFMAIYAQGRIIPAYVASFAPIAIGGLLAGVLIVRKNL